VTSRPRTGRFTLRASATREPTPNYHPLYFLRQGTPVCGRRFDKTPSTLTQTFVVSLDRSKVRHNREKRLNLPQLPAAQQLLIATPFGKPESVNSLKTNGGSHV
jgi:hypothetical protein